LVAALATGLLAITNQVTAPAIAAGAQKEQEKALNDIFFNGFARSEIRRAEYNGQPCEYFAVYMKSQDKVPDFYVIPGKGLGYNKSVPIELLAGFVNPRKKGVQLPGNEKFTAGRNLLCAGWKIIKSQETPGLGENAKMAQAEYTWAQLLSGKRPPQSRDHRTPFQKQFAGREPQTMVAKKNIDIITGATYSTQGIISALQDASSKLQKILPLP